MKCAALWLAGMLCLAVAVTAEDAGSAAGPAPDAAARPGAPNGGRGAGLDSGALFWMARQMDVNGNLLVDEKELKEGFAKFGTNAAAVCADLLTWLDRDKDGTVSLGEWKPFFTAMAMLSQIRSVDKNGDLVLQEGELAAALTRMTEFCKSANERTLRQFDRDHDGQLSEEEIQAARQAMRRFNPHAMGAKRDGAGGGVPPNGVGALPGAPAGGGQ